MRIDAFVFPQLCVLCDAPRSPDDRWLCSRCSAAITASIDTRESCSRCGQNPKLRSCSCAHAWDYPFDAICSFTDYSADIQTLMHLVKYRGMKKLSLRLGELCARSARYESVFMNADMLVPVPLHKSRLQKRGYNQAEWFARGLGNVHGALALHPSLLQRTKATGTQTELDRSERGANVAGAFTIAAGKADAVRDKKIVLVDDVITTGATTSAAAEALLAGGCAGVTAVSFARD